MQTLKMRAERGRRSWNSHISRAFLPFLLFISAPATFSAEPRKTTWQGTRVNAEEKSGQWLGATVISTSRSPSYGQLLVSSV